MSLFDLQDVCIAIGSLATLDLPMVVDLIGIYVLKGPYCTLTTTNWFLQALSVIPRGSWGDPPYFTLGRPSSPSTSRRLAPPRAAAVCRHLRDRTCFDHRDEEFPSVLNSSVLLVQADEGVLIRVVDLIRRIYRRLQFKSQISLRILVEARRLDASKRNSCFKLFYAILLDSSIQFFLSLDSLRLVATISIWFVTLHYVCFSCVWISCRLDMQNTVACDWVHCSLQLVDQLVKICLKLVIQTLVVKCLRLDYPTTATGSSLNPSTGPLARRQNDVVSIYPNDIILLSLTSNTIDWFYCSSLLIVMTSLLTSSSLIPDSS
ncbi:Amidase family protein isoform 1 [Dorcoceras hygrometricum]|uniref:Amidase family protein isoform 1 n=1 Tax=Dorcoceras hygrometricum TaxID=472368 RepID=A0A2Z7APS4_9LAMI|nr:Amidase family protein isoform 1 [Dorcoceras hygrometricum]